MSHRFVARFILLVLTSLLVAAGCETPEVGVPQLASVTQTPTQVAEATPTRQPALPAILATVPLGPGAQGHGPSAVAVDEASGRVYVALYDSDAVGIITPGTSEAQGTTMTMLPVGSHPRALALNPATGRLFVANYGGSSVTLVDVLPGQPARVVKTVPVGDRPVSLVAERTTGRVYVACEGARTLEVLEGESGGIVATLTSERPVGPLTLAVDSNAGRVYVGYYSSIVVLDMRDWRVQAEWAVGSTSFLVVDPDAGQLYTDRYTTEEGAQVAAVDLKTGQVKATLKVGTQPRAAALDPATRFLLVANESSNDVSIVALTLWRVLTTASVGPGPVAVAVNATTGRAYVACQGADRIAVVDEAARRTETVIPTAISPRDVAALDDRAYVVSPSAEQVYVVDAARQQVAQTISVGQWPVAVASDEGSHRIYVANAGDNTLSAIEPTRMIVGATVPLGLSPGDVAVDSTKGRVYAGQAVVDESTHQVVDTFKLTGITVSPDIVAEQLAVDPGGGYLYVGAWNGVMGSNGRRVVYRMDMLSLRQSPPGGILGGEYDSMTAMDVDPGARRIYVAGAHPILGKATLAVYDADGGAWLASLPLAVRCSALAVNPTTGHLFLALSGSRLAVLDAATLGTVVVLPLPDEGNAVAVDARYNRVYVTHPGIGSLTIVSDVPLPPPPPPNSLVRPTPSPTPTYTPSPTLPPASGIPLTPGRQATPAAASTPPPPTSSAPCTTPEGPAGALWFADAAVRRRLGCPLTPLQGVIVSEQRFEHGLVFWRADIRYFYVLYEYGRWAGYQETYGGEPGTTETPPAGMTAPGPGFARIWHTEPGVRQKLGWALDTVHRSETVMQVYQGGLVLRDDQNVTRILFTDDGTWTEVKR